PMLRKLQRLKKLSQEPLPFGCAEGPPRRAGRRHGITAAPKDLPAERGGGMGSRLRRRTTPPSGEEAWGRGCAEGPPRRAGRRRGVAAAPKDLPAERGGG